MLPFIIKAGAATLINVKSYIEGNAIKYNGVNAHISGIVELRN